MTILVTGGAGYIGSHCTKILLERGYDVVVCDNMVKGHPEAIEKIASQNKSGASLKLYTGFIGDEQLMDRIFTENKIDAVMHFAAFSLVGESMEKPYEYYKNNVGESMSLFHSMVTHGVLNIVFSSTAATYGQAKEDLITEETPNLPINTYGETKLSIEKMLKWFGVAYGLKSTCLRYFNVAGAYPDGSIGEAHNPETHLIPIVLQAAAGIRPVMKVFGGDYPTPDGTCVRDYIHVCDLIDAHILALERMIKTGESSIFNLGTGGGTSNLEIIEAARRVTGKPIPTEITPRRPGDPAILVASSRKAEEVLGWKRKYGIEDIISHAWKWHSEHPNGYGR